MAPVIAISTIGARVFCRPKFGSTARCTNRPFRPIFFRSPGEFQLDSQRRQRSPVIQRLLLGDGTTFQRERAFFHGSGAAGIRPAELSCSAALPHLLPLRPNMGRYPTKAT